MDSGGSYSIYYALAVASRELDVDHRFVEILLMLCSSGCIVSHPPLKTRFHKYGASGTDRAVSTMGQSSQNCRHGSMGSSNPMGF